MNKKLLTLSTCALAAFASFAEVLDLAGEWRLSTPSSAKTYPCRIPGDNATALLEAGDLKDPFYRNQESDAQWIGNVDWVFSRKFDASESLLAHRAVILEFASVDTCAAITLNGAPVASVTNEFRRWRFDVTKIIRPGENALSVRVSAPRRVAEELWLTLRDYDVRSWGVTSERAINWLRKCQCSFGWDWGVSLPVSGLYGGVRLFTADTAELEYASAVAKLNDDGSADITISASVRPLEGTPKPEMTVVFDGVATKVNASAYVVHLERPELWWPAGMGAQKLYPWSVTVDGQSVGGRVGIRHLELVRERDEVGETFGFRVNGRDFFAMGADWIPADAFPSRRTPARIRKLLESALAANMNTVRVWGGGVYECDEFYDICDELGLLVWQDFMFACARYPATDSFLAEIAAEARHQVRRLRSHPSILLWCGDNECISAVREPCKYRDDWVKWNGALADAVRENAPEAIWWPSSPCAGPGNFTYNEYTGDSGDTHYWGVWHGSRDLSGYYQLKPRFCSEFGYQSYPSLATVKTFADEKRGDWSFDSATMRNHQKNSGGNAKINKMMEKYFRTPRDFASHLYVSQIQQALAIEVAVAYWRSLWPHCRGTIVWQLNDWWPVASWSSLEYDGRWKPLQYVLKRAYARDYPAARRAEELRKIDFKTADLPVSNIRIESVKKRSGREYEVTVACDAKAYFVWLEDAEDPETRFDDNLVDLEAGRRVFICTTARETDEKSLGSRLSVRDLRGAYAD